MVLFLDTSSSLVSSTILPDSQAVRHQTLTLAFPKFESWSGSHFNLHHQLSWLERPSDTREVLSSSLRWCTIFGGLAELVQALVLETSEFTRVGSSPTSPTISFMAWQLSWQSTRLKIWVSVVQSHPKPPLILIYNFYYRNAPALAIQRRYFLSRVGNVV